MVVNEDQAKVIVQIYGLFITVLYPWRSPRVSSPTLESLHRLGWVDSMDRIAFRLMCGDGFGPEGWKAEKNTGVPLDVAACRTIGAFLFLKKK